MSNITLTMIKPEAVEAGNAGAILHRIEDEGFIITSLKKMHLTVAGNWKKWRFQYAEPIFIVLSSSVKAN